MRGYLAKVGMRVIHHEGDGRGGTGPGTILDKLVRKHTKSHDRARLRIEWDTGLIEWLPPCEVKEHILEHCDECSSDLVREDGHGHYRTCSRYDRDLCPCAQPRECGACDPPPSKPCIICQDAPTKEGQASCAKERCQKARERYASAEVRTDWYGHVTIHDPEKA